MTAGRRVAGRSRAAATTDVVIRRAAAVAAVSRGAGRMLARLTVLCLVAAAALVVTGWEPVERDRADVVAAPQVNLKKLPLSSTRTRTARAPKFRDTPLARAGTVVHPIRPVAVFARPGRRAVAKVRPSTLGPTWLPVVARRPGWVRVLLPSRPNAASGWIARGDLETRRSDYAVRVHLGSRTLVLLHDGRRVGSWSVAVGAPETPTPTGLTFVHALIQDPGQSYSPYLMPLGAHSDTLDSYGGGPGTVAFHGWPDSSVFGQAVSHGCIRVPDDALERLTQVPLGTQVSIDAG